MCNLLNWNQEDLGAAYPMWYLHIMPANRKHIWPWIVSCVVLMIAYPLSIGPAWWLRNHGMIPSSAQNALTSFYFPLGWVTKQSETTNNAMIWYVHHWNPSPKH